MSLTQEQIRGLIHYDAVTGKCTWRERHGADRVTKMFNTLYSGKRVGGPDQDGYLKCTLAGKTYRVPRLIWLYAYGYIPKDNVDHINGVKDDDRLSNLREATNSQNHQNLSIRTKTESGLMGATRTSKGGRWQANIIIEGKKMYLGCYATPEEAHAVYLAAKKVLHKFQPEPRDYLKVVA